MKVSIERKCLISVLSILILCTFSSNAQFHYKAPPKRLIKEVSVKIDKQKFKDISLYLPTGYVKDGTVDYTIYLQKAIDENDKLLMPNFPVLINDSGIHLADNSQLFFQKKSKIILAPSNKTNYGIINIKEKNNVILYNPILVGDRLTHIGNTGEWGMGINILNSSNIEIYNSDISNCWGDGIYLGSKQEESTNEKILIIGGKIDNNRRNAISIISGSNVLIRDLLLSNSNGTLPMAGIDFEPNNNREKLENLKVENTTTYNNGDAGFLIYLGGMLGTQDNLVHIDITNCKDYFSKKSISIPGLRNDYHSSIKKIDGVINILFFHSYKSKMVFEKSSGNYIYTPQIKVSNLEVFSEGKRDKGIESKLSQWMKTRGIIVTD